MTRFNRIIATYLFLLSGLFIAQQALASLANDLQDGQHVLLMRHAVLLATEILLGMSLVSVPASVTWVITAKSKPRQ